MAALVVSAGLIAAAWISHVVWWRSKLPKSHTAALLLVFAATPLIAVVVWIASGAPAIVFRYDLPGIVAFYLGAAGCYLILYTGVEQTSPSLLIIRALEAAADKGCVKEDLASLITEQSLIGPRLNALKFAGLIVPAKGGFVLTSRGRRAARAALLFSRVFDIHQTS